MSEREATMDPISASVSEVLSTFRDALSDIRFPEVDRAALEALAEDVRAHAASAALAKVTLAGAVSPVPATQENATSRTSGADLSVSAG